MNKCALNFLFSAVISEESEENVGEYDVPGVLFGGDISAISCCTPFAFHAWAAKN